MSAPQIVLLTLLILFLLLCLLPVGAGAEYGAEGAKVRLTVGPLGFVLFPRPAKEKKRKKKRPSGDQKAPPPAARAKPRGREKLRAQADFLLALLPIARDALLRMGKALRVDVFRLNLTLPGADDPAKGAERYGTANAALGALWTPLNEALDIRDGRAWVDLDFQAEKPSLYARADLSIRVGAGLAVSLSCGVRALICYLRHRKSLRGATTGGTPTETVKGGA